MNQRTSMWFSQYLIPPQSFLFWSQNVNIARTKLGVLPFFFKYIFCYCKGSSYVKIVNSFLWINIWTFSKKAHEFAFHPWKGQSTSINYPLAIVSNLHHVDSLQWLKKNLCKKACNQLNHQQPTLMQKNSTFEELFKKWLEEFYFIFSLLCLRSKEQ